MLGIYFLFYSSFLAKKFVALHPEFPNLDLTSIETERFLMTFGLYFLASILLMIVGNSLYIPQYYAYSQVEFLLCDTLDLGQAKPGQILKTSRFLMKGYKFQRFVLDLQLLPWYFLNWITFGIASFSLLPYIQINKIIFYRAVLARKTSKKLEGGPSSFFLSMSFSTYQLEVLISMFDNGSDCRFYPSPNIH